MTVVVPVFEIGMASLFFLTAYYIKNILYGVKLLILNSVSGLSFLLVANILGAGIDMSPIVLLEVAIGGILSGIWIVFTEYFGFTALRLGMTPWMI
jgi:hypothetical protein